MVICRGVVESGRLRYWSRGEVLSRIVGYGMSRWGEARFGIFGKARFVTLMCRKVRLSR